MLSTRNYRPIRRGDRLARDYPIITIERQSEIISAIKRWNILLVEETAMSFVVGGRDGLSMEKCTADNRSDQIQIMLFNTFNSFRILWFRFWR